ncbi:hypothetical protein MXE38_05835 [Anaerobiospirillum sp. NML120448]|uniref:hypothetical protein n=1 Tax=Anaerobiospirillum sp. NML120448 TaxID=2932816 RepID=UPI001FF6E428|nr:hypothetical protein [Anaerobiospirillum sp. NML120448]MCK0514375.1 hypothetical protein [Anaerobiospirillum sp. NML120448]
MTYNSDLPEQEKSENIISIGALIEDENEFDDRYQIDSKNHLQVKMTKAQQECLRLAKESGLKTPFGEGEVVIEEPVHKTNWFDMVLMRNRAILEQQFEDEVYGTNLRNIAQNLYSEENQFLGPNLGAVLGERDNKDYEAVYKSEIGSDNYHKEDMGRAAFSGDSFIYQYKNNSSKAQQESQGPKLSQGLEESHNSQLGTTNQESIGNTSPSNSKASSSQATNSFQDQGAQESSISALNQANTPQDEVHNVLPVTSPDLNKSVATESYLSNSVSRALDDPYNLDSTKANQVDTNDYSTYHNNFANEDAKRTFNEHENYQFALDEVTKETQSLQSSLNSESQAHNKKEPALDTNFLAQQYAICQNLHMLAQRRAFSRCLIPDKHSFVLDKNSMPLMPIELEEANILLEAKLARQIEPDLIMLNLAIGDILPNIDRVHSILEHCFLLPERPHQLWLSVEIENYIVFKYWLDNQLVYHELIDIPDELLDYADLALKQFYRAPSLDPNLPKGILAGIEQGLRTSQITAPNTCANLSSIAAPFANECLDSSLDKAFKLSKMGSHTPEVNLTLQYGESHKIEQEHKGQESSDSFTQDNVYILPTPNSNMDYCSSVSNSLSLMDDYPQDPSISFAITYNDEEQDEEPNNSCYIDEYESFAFTIAQKITRLRKVLPITYVEVGALQFDFTKLLR